MNWKLLLTTFATVFVAELGDKTQLATLSLSTSGNSRLSVFVGSAAALVCTSAIAVFFGEALTRLVSPRTLHRLAGVLLVVLGALMLWSTFRPQSE